MNKFYSVLCGCTFFNLLLKEKQSGKSKKWKQQYGTDGINDSEILKELIKIFDDNFQEPAGDSFKNRTSRYKFGEISYADCLPFNEKSIIDAFDENIKSSYNANLIKMYNFVNKFLSIHEPTKINEIVCLLVDLIKKDESIQPSDTFYINVDGSPSTKIELLTKNEFNIYSFLLGIWHFIVVQRPDNTIGKETINRWLPKPEITGARRNLINCDLNTISSNITISTELDIETQINNEKETIIENNIPNSENEEKNTVSNDTAFILNSNTYGMINFNQIANFGNIGNIQINNYNNGGKNE